MQQRGNTLHPLLARLPYFLLFILSGFSGLVFEVVWVRVASHTLGVTVYAVSVVVSAFMAGLALGGVLAGRLADRRGLGLRAYALIELLICVSGLTATKVLKECPALLAGTGLTGSASLFLGSLLVGVLLIIPCTLMGATVPILGRVVAQTDHPSRMVGLLYGSNIVGAVIGALAADFVLIPNIGVFSAALFGGGLNAVAGVVAFCLPAKSAEPREPSSEHIESGQGAWLLYLSYGLLGFSALALQVVWVRVLLVLLSSKVFTFSVILATYLACLSIGTGIASQISSKTKNPGFSAVLCLCLMSVTTILGLLLMGRSDHFIGTRSFQTLHALSSPFFGETSVLVIPAFLRSLALFGFPTVLSGALFPFFCSLALRSSKGLSAPIGYLYSSNTLGAILGSLLGGFLLLPILGVQWSVGLLSGTVLLSAVLIFGHLESARISAGKLMSTLAAVVVGVYFVLPGDWVFYEVNLAAYQRTWDVPADKIRDFREDLYGSIAVGTNRAGHDVLLVNQIHMMGSTPDSKRYAYLMAHLPLAVHPNPKKGLVVCFGLGMTFGAMSTHPNLEKLQCVELSPAVIELSEHFREHNFSVVSRDDPRVKIDNEDGRNFLLRTEEKYDVITFEPPPPESAGVVNLYSADYYRLCRERLTEDGLVCQWLPIHTITERGGKLVVKTFLEVFPTATLWKGAGTDYILIGGMSKQKFDLERFSEVAKLPGMSEIGITDGKDLLSTFLQDSESLAKYSEGTQVVTDDLPYLEYQVGPPALAPELTKQDVQAFTRHLAEMSAPEKEQLMERFADFGQLSSLGVPVHENQSLEGLRRFKLSRHLLQRLPANDYTRDLLMVSPKRLDWLRQNLRQEPTSPVALRNLGFSLLVAKEYDEAKSVLGRWVSLQPQEPLAHLLTGLAAHETLDSDTATRAIDTGLSLVPEQQVRAAIKENLEDLLRP